MHAVSLNHWSSTPSWFGLEPGRKLQPSPRLAIYDINQSIMKKSINDITKKETRPPANGGRELSYALPMPANLIAEVEAWATANDTSRSDAFRALVEIGLTKK